MITKNAPPALGKSAISLRNHLRKSRALKLFVFKPGSARGLHDFEKDRPRPEKYHVGLGLIRLSEASGLA
jgi:hypothetical protein